MRLLFASQSAKERAERNSQEVQRILDARLLRRDFPVEVLSVPLSHAPIAFQKGASHAEIIQALQSDLQKTVLCAEVTRVSWIYGKKSWEPKKGGHVPERASLILYLSKEEDQTQAVSKGVVIHGEHHMAFLYHSRLQIPQCFHCSQWGHTQKSCRARVSCGFCAQRHNTRDCKDREN